jgi:hypothetical protein
MLIQIREDPGINSFAQLYWRTIELLSQHCRDLPRTMVLGPISHDDPSVVTQNLDALTLQAQRLSNAGLVVVDIASYYDITKRLIRSHKIAGYPFVLLEEFTLPLIRSGLFGTLHFRSPFDHSVGTKREYEEAELYRIEIRIFS